MVLRTPFRRDIRVGPSTVNNIVVSKTNIVDKRVCPLKSSTTMYVQLKRFIARIIYFHFTTPIMAIPM